MTREDYQKLCGLIMIVAGIILAIVFSVKFNENANVAFIALNATMRPYKMVGAFQ